jgi:hypothetical protein
MFIINVPRLLFSGYSQVNVWHETFFFPSVSFLYKLVAIYMFKMFKLCLLAENVFSVGACEGLVLTHYSW